MTATVKLYCVYLCVQNPGNQLEPDRDCVLQSLRGFHTVLDTSLEVLARRCYDEQTRPADSSHGLRQKSLASIHLFESSPCNRQPKIAGSISGTPAACRKLSVRLGACCIHKNC